MLKEIQPEIYLNEIDLPNNPLKYLNSYIIIGGERTLIIDTGFNRPECIESFFAGIKELQIDLAATDIFITHLHSDHCGLISELQQKGARILLGELEAQAILELDTKEYWDRFRERAIMFDLAKYEVQIEDHPGYRFRPQKITSYLPLQEGQNLNYGRYNFKVLHVPGHTKGHIALYEPVHKFFIGGDLILAKITPTITFWGFEQDILQVYFDTLAKVKKLEIKLLLTGHRALLPNAQARIAELLQHHQARLEEIKGILSTGKQSVAEVASKMTWEITAKSWAEFPKAQKWFATSEAMAHLEHLYITGWAERESKAKLLIYSKK